MDTNNSPRLYSFLRTSKAFTAMIVAAHAVCDAHEQAPLDHLPPALADRWQRLSLEAMSFIAEATFPDSPQNKETTHGH